MKRRPVQPDTPASAGRLIGYGRVSTLDQSPDLQRQALLKAGVHPDNLHIDEGWSGTIAKRPGLSLAMLDVREGDTLVVWKLDRLGRDMAQLIRNAEHLQEVGVGLRSLTEPIDTSHPMGRAFFFIIGVFAQLERDLISERTAAGIAAAKARGKRFGRAPKLTRKEWLAIERAIRNGARTDDLAKEYGISLSLLAKRVAVRKLRALGPLPKASPKAQGSRKLKRKR